MTNLSLFLAESARRYPDAAALRCDNATTTYSVLATDAARAADYLIDRGLESGDRAGLMLPNSPAFAALFYGVLHAGGVVVPMNPASTCIPRTSAGAYNDMHCIDGPANGRRDTRWGLQPALLTSAPSGWSLRRFGGGRAS